MFEDTEEGSSEQVHGEESCGEDEIKVDAEEEYRFWGWGENDSFEGEE